MWPRRRARWRRTPPEALHTIDDQDHPAQPYSLPLPNPVLREASSTADIGYFYAIGEAWAQMVARYLPPNPTVLDLGCGCGKLARFLYLIPDLTYTGVDIYAPAIRWRQKAFAPAGERFRFVHFDGRSELYNPAGSVAPSDYVLPLADGEIDMTVCASLFTHLQEADARHYLSEIRRVSGPAGQAIVSIHDKPPPGRRFAGDAVRIDIEEGYFAEMCADAGMPVAERIGAVYGQTVFRLKRDG